MRPTFFINTSAYDIDVIYIKGLDGWFKVEGQSLQFDDFSKSITFETIISGVKGRFTFDYESVAGVKHRSREVKQV